MTIKNEEYKNLVEDILSHEEFNKLKDIRHHGMNRYDHSVRVSYISYKFSKILKLDTKQVARAALLHDFFFEDNMIATKKEKMQTMTNHPKIAADNADKYFGISELERDIIETHMFPISLKLPKYLESWMVDLIDDGASIYERLYSVRRELTAAASFILILLQNNLR